MTYDDLLIEADSQGLITKEKPLRGSEGRIKGNHIAVKQDMPAVQKACALAEELGHYHTSVGDILDLSRAENRKQEYRAKLWAYNKQVGLTGILDAFLHGYRDIHEMAEYLDVTEDFLREALVCYRSKYGLYCQVDNYILYFEPLGVLELYH